MNKILTTVIGTGAAIAIAMAPSAAADPGTGAPGTPGGTSAASPSASTAGVPGVPGAGAPGARHFVSPGAPGGFSQLRAFLERLLRSIQNAK